MIKKSHEKVQWMFVGSRATESEEVNATSKIRDKMPRKERDLHSSYLSIEEREMPILLDEKKCVGMFGPMFGNYESLFFHKVLSSDKKTFRQKIGKFFQNGSEASMIVYSGNARESDGTWLIESCKLTDEANVAEDSISFDDVLAAWKNRNKCQKHLLLIIDANYSGHWLRRLSTTGESTITIQTSSRYWQKTTEDRHVGGYFLHNLFKVVRDLKGEQIMEPTVYKQSPGFYGNFHYVMRYFGLVLKFESWQDMRQAISEKEFGNWPRIKDFVRTPFSKMLSDSQYDDYHLNNFFIDKNGNRYEGNVDRNNNKEGFGVLYYKSNVLQYEGQFKNDLKQGKGILYDEEGYKYYEGDFSEDVLVGNGKNFDRMGFVNFIGPLVNNLKEGAGKEYDKNGKVIYTGTYTEGLRQGPGLENHGNGQLKTEGVWFYGKLGGFAKEFNEDGFLVFEGEYLNGNRTGPCKTYYSDGRLHFDGTMLNGLYHGYGKIWNRGGELNCEGEFINGNMQGQGTAYYLNGNLMFNGEFENGKAIAVGILRQQTGVISAIGKVEDVVREVLTSTVYTERKRNKKFEDKGVLENKLGQSQQLKANFLLKTAHPSDAHQLNTSALINSSYVQRQANESTLNGMSLNETREHVGLREKLNPLNPKGKNDMDGEKRYKATRHSIDYRKKRVMDKMERESQQVNRSSKAGLSKNSNSLNISELKATGKVIDSTLRDNLLCEKVKDLQIQVSPNNGVGLNLKSSSSTMVPLVSKQSQGDMEFANMYVKKFESDDEDQIKQEIYGHKLQEVNSEKYLEAKKPEAEIVKNDSKNVFLKKDSIEKMNEFEKRDQKFEDSNKIGQNKPESPVFKKVSTEPKFEFVGSFKQKQPLLSLQNTENKLRDSKEMDDNETTKVPWFTDESGKKISVVGDRPNLESISPEIQTRTEKSQPVQANVSPNSFEQAKGEFNPENSSKRSSKKSFGVHAKKKSIKATLKIDEEENGVKSYLMNV